MTQFLFFPAILVVMLTAQGPSFAQSDAVKVGQTVSRSAKGASENGCSFSVVGVWKSDATSETNPVFWSFSPTGWVTVLNHTEGALPQDFDMMAQAQYRLDDPVAPTRIEFTAKGKNDAFAPGKSALEIIQYSDDSFTIANLKTGYRTRWNRVQSGRYFLTFAARSGAGVNIGPVYAVWTSLDGRRIETEAIGVHTKGEPTATASFEVVPAEVYSAFAKIAGDPTDNDSKRDEVKAEDAKRADSSVVIRLEVSESDFQRSHKIYEVWEKYVAAKALPNADPYLNMMELLTTTAESLNRCGERIKLHKTDASKTDDIIARNKIPQRPLEYIRLLRKKNNSMHVTEAAFPWNWRPTVEPSH